MTNKLSKFFLLSQFAISIACERNYPLCGSDCNDISTSFDESSTIDNNLPTGDIMTSTSDDAITEINETTNYTPFCGDGILDEGEFCDNGSENKQYNEASMNDCTIDCKFSFCGDNILNKDEECDGPDACNNCIQCGNGILTFPEQCDDGNFGTLDNCNLECRNTFVAFVTSQTFTGDFGNLNEADKICQNALLNSTYDNPYFKKLTVKAWISNDDESPLMRFSEKFKFHEFVIINMDHYIVEKGWNELNTGIMLPLNVDENGNQILGNEFAWTGNKSDKDVNNNCSNWTSKDSLTFGNIGSVQSNGNEWQFYTDDIEKLSCANKHHLYCFSQ